MLKRVSLLLLVLFISNLTAQNPKPDWDEWDDDWVNFQFDYSFGKSPYLELNYGLGELKLKDYNEKFAKTSLLELRLGYRSVDDYYEDYIIKVRDNYSFVQFSSPELRTKDLKNSELNVEHWQFGFGFLKGYGYKIGNFSITPFTDFNVNWTKLDYKNISDYSLFYLGNFNRTIDTKPIDLYKDSFRFGTTNSVGVKLEIAERISLNGSYDMSVIYPRHLFWKNTGSLITEAIGIGFIDYFVDEVMDSTPEAVPILNALLKGGVSYAFFSLRKDNMNWPFGGVNPVTYENFRIGLTFTF